MHKLSKCFGTPCAAQGDGSEFAADRLGAEGPRSRCRVWLHLPSSRLLPCARGEGDSVWHVLVGFALLCDSHLGFFKNRNCDRIGEFLYTRKNQQTPFAKTVNDALAQVPQDVPMTACVRSTGLTHNGDEVHFDGKSLRELGKRYATEMLKLQGTMSRTK